MMKADYTSELTALLNDEIGGYYVAGTLFIGEYGFTLGEFADSKSVVRKIFGEGRELLPQENKLVAELYLKHKTPQHAFYKRATEIINETKSQ